MAIKKFILAPLMNKIMLPVLSNKSVYIAETNEKKQNQVRDLNHK